MAIYLIGLDNVREKTSVRVIVPNYQTFVQIHTARFLPSFRLQVLQDRL